MTKKQKLSSAVRYYVLVYRTNRNNQMDNVFMAAILNFRELFSLKYMTL